LNSARAIRQIIHNVAVHRCIKGSFALSSLVMVETLVHRLLQLYDANVNRFVVPSRFVREKMIEWGWARERFAHIPNFVDVEQFHPGRPIGRRFVYCGRLQSLKGVETLVRAGQRAKVPVSIASAGPDEIRLRKLGEEPCADVEFAGHLCKDALIDLIQSARTIVIPSEVNENSPLALLEAYAAGDRHRKPACCSPRGGSNSDAPMLRKQIIKATVASGLCARGRRA
jgi:glycosyltransferase involved in cell wall biosynthesis